MAMSTMPIRTSPENAYLYIHLSSANPVNAWGETSIQEPTKASMIPTILRMFGISSRRLLKNKFGQGKPAIICTLHFRLTSGSRIR
jgi:hypothetical protein